jgi:2-keto-3-deoxy-L-rhamnonate aldolase RhmA
VQNSRLSFRQRLAAGEQLIGVVLTLSDPSVAETMARAGFDWLWVDGEHSPLDVADFQSIAQAAGDCPCLVRVPSIDEAWIKKTLDTGVEGIIFPLVNHREQAERAVSLSKYPPMGTRSVGISRAQGYGPGFDRYMRQANDWVCSVAQIEHIDAILRLDEILEVPGIDALLIGPYDLSASMGKPGAVDDPEVRRAIEDVRLACQAAGKPVGIFAGNIARARQALEQGFNLIGAGIDVRLLADLAAQILAQLKPAL